MTLLYFNTINNMLWEEGVGLHSVASSQATGVLPRIVEIGPRVQGLCFSLLLDVLLSYVGIGVG